MSKVIRYMPELTGDEQVHVAQWMKQMTDEQAQHFAHVYRQRRKDETTTLITALIGLVVVAGIHRFYLGQIGMGLLYLFTAGFCVIGTIVDVVNHKSLTAKYNMAQADDVARLITGAFPEKMQLADAPKVETPPTETPEANPAKNAAGWPSSARLSLATPSRPVPARAVAEARVIGLMSAGSS